METGGFIVLWMFRSAERGTLPASAKYPKRRWGRPRTISSCYPRRPQAPRLHGGRTIGNSFLNLTGAGKNMGRFPISIRCRCVFIKLVKQFFFHRCAWCKQPFGFRRFGPHSGIVGRGAKVSNRADILFFKSAAAAVERKKHIPVFCPRQASLFRLA